MLVSLNKANKSFQLNQVFLNIDFQINENEKVALIGRNGTGKTTLLKIIAKEESLDSGNLLINSKIKIGYLKQVIFEDKNLLVKDYLRAVFTDLIDLEDKLKIYEGVSNLSKDEALKYSQLLQTYEKMGGYHYQTKINTIFSKFGFIKEDFKRLLKDFSGGQQTKLAFVRLLLEEPDLLLLDEPTNHLDLKTIVWLEGYLKNYPHSVVIISHDRKFINEIVNIVYELEHLSITKYYGNYDLYKTEKIVNAESLRRRYVAETKKIKQIEEFIEKNRYQKTKASLVQSKIKQLEKLDRIKLNPPSEQVVKFNFKPKLKGGKQVLQVQNLSFGYNTSLGKISLDVYQGNKIGIIGANGIGKSTLIKTLAEKIKPLGGELLYGHQIKMSYFDQNLIKSDRDISVIDYLWELNPHLTHTEIRTLLGSFSFFEDEVFKGLNVLSGGEQVRLALLKLMLEGANLLLLDEPTNHLDLATKESFETALKDYPATVIFVSHDRYFLKEVATSLIVFEDNEVNYYPFDYEEYLNKEKAVVKNKTKEKKIVAKKPNQYQIKRIEKGITTLENEIIKLNDLAFIPEYYLDYEKNEELKALLLKKEEELENLLEIWENHHLNLD